MDLVVRAGLCSSQTGGAIMSSKFPGVMGSCPPLPVVESLRGNGGRHASLSPVWEAFSVLKREGGSGNH